MNHTDKLQQYNHELQKINNSLYKLMDQVKINQSRFSMVNSDNVPNQDSIDQLQKENQALLDQINEYKTFLENIKVQFSVLMQEVEHLKE